MRSTGQSTHCRVSVTTSALSNATQMKKMSVNLSQQPPLPESQNNAYCSSMNISTVKITDCHTKLF